MNKYRNPARLLALLLALTLAFSLTALPAAAEGSGRPTFSGEVYAGINNVGVPTVTVSDYSATEPFPLQQPGERYPAGGTPMVTYDSDNPVTVTVSADIETRTTGISAMSAPGYSVTVTAGNITGTGGESTAVSAAGDARITAGTITADGEYSYGMRVFDGADVTAESVSAAGEGGRGVFADGSGATVSVQKGIEADRGIELWFQDGAEFGITVGGDVTAKSHGLYVIPNEDFPYDSTKPGRADVVIGGTLSGQNPIVLGDGIGNDSLNLTVWKIQSGEGGFSGTMRLMPEEGTGKYKLVQDTSGFDRTIQYIIRVQQPDVEGATLSVTDKDGKTLDPVQTTDGTVLGAGAATEGQKVYLVVSTGFKITTAYNNGSPIKQDDAGNWYIEIPKGGGVVLSADVEKKTFTISFYNAKGDQTPLWSGSFSYGETPVYKGETTPTKAADEQYTYTWNSGWDPKLVEAVEDTSYYATFAKTANTDTVTEQDPENPNQNQGQGQNPDPKQGQGQGQGTNTENDNESPNQGNSSNPNNTTPQNRQFVNPWTVASGTGAGDNPTPTAGNGNGVWTYSPDTADDNLLVQGTVYDETVKKEVGNVLDPLPVDNEFTTLLDNSHEIFQNSFNIENGKMLDSGIVDFGGEYDNSAEEIIAVPLQNQSYLIDNTYTVVYSDGTVVHAVCTKAGVLWIPFPHDADGLAFVVLEGTVESSQLVKHAILAAETQNSATLQINPNEGKSLIVGGIHQNDDTKQGETVSGQSGSGSSSYEVHLQAVGWAGASGASEFGTTGQSRRPESISLSVPGQSVDGGISYEAHAQPKGWMPAATDGALAGTTGQARRLEAVRISLTGAAAKEGGYSVWYRVHSQTYGWLGWAHDDEPAGTTGLARRAEAIDVQVLPQGQVPRGYDASPVAVGGGTSPYKVG